MPSPLANRGVPPDVLSGDTVPLCTSICTRNAVLEGPLLDTPRLIVDFNGSEIGQQDLQAMGVGRRPSPSRDVDRDGSLALPDVQLALRAVAGATVLSARQRIAGDLNEDDRLDLKDVSLLLRQAIGG
jgi:hypothetical protein